MAYQIDPVRRALVQAEQQSRLVASVANRSFDLALAALGLLIFAPLMLLVGALIWLERRGPALFAHPRIGCGGTIFRVFKFRTMAVDSDHLLAAHLESNDEAREEWSRDHKLRQDPRITAIGGFLRRSSLDELPQLFNVLRGEMSIVGPRPIVAAEEARYGSLFGAYCSVKPGITGIWQVSGRNDVSYQRRVEMDALYARKKSVFLDVRIVLATVPAVLMRKGSY